MLEEYDVEGIPVDEVRNNSIVEGTYDFKSNLLRGLIHGHGSVNDEGQDMWKVNLDLKECTAKLSNCRDFLQRDPVSKDFLEQPYRLRRLTLSSIEEITLKLISVQEQDALGAFLLWKFDDLANDDICQITMISMWAPELYLDKINRLRPEDDAESVIGIMKCHSITCLNWVPS